MARYLIKSEEGVSLLGGRCSNCGYVSFPFKKTCSACGNRGAVEKEGLGGTGVVLESMVSYVGVEGFEPPYALGFVVLDSGPQVFTTFVAGENDQFPKAGERVALDVPVDPDEDAETADLAWRFRAANANEEGGLQSA